MTRDQVVHDAMRIVHRGQAITLANNTFHRMARIDLLRTLREHCSALGIAIEFGRKVEDIDEFDDCDLVVAADGAASAIRTRYREHFEPMLDVRPNLLAWYGTTAPVRPAVAHLPRERRRPADRARLPLQRARTARSWSNAIRRPGARPGSTGCRKRRASPIASAYSATISTASRCCRTGPSGSATRSSATGAGTGATSCCSATRCAPAIRRSARARGSRCRMRSRCSRRASRSPTCRRARRIRAPAATRFRRAAEGRDQEHGVVRDGPRALCARPGVVRLRLPAPHRPCRPRGRPCARSRARRRLRGPASRRSPAMNDRADFYTRIAGRHLRPLWEVLDDLVPPHPRPPARAALWRYDDVRPALMESGELITAMEAVRRVLDPRESRAARLVADHQRALRRAAAHPSRRGGAFAPAYAERAALHRRRRRRVHGRRRRAHDDGARRFHHHAVVDLARPRQRRRRAGRVARRPRHPDRRAARRAVRRALPGGRPARSPGRKATPMRAGERTWRSLTAVTSRARRPCSTTRTQEAARARDARRGRRLRPGARRADALRQSGHGRLGDAHARHLPADGCRAAFAALPHRSTDGTVYCCVEGRGTIRIGDDEFEWGPRDVFVAPSWQARTLTATTDAGAVRLFGPARCRRSSGLLREESEGG